MLDVSSSWQICIHCSKWVYVLVKYMCAPLQSAKVEEVLILKAFFDSRNGELLQRFKHKEKWSDPVKKMYKVYIYTGNKRYMNEKILRLFKIFKRNYNTTLGCRTRRQTQMLARARHWSSLKLYFNYLKKKYLFICSRIHWGMTSRRCIFIVLLSDEFATGFRYLWGGSLTRTTGCTSWRVVKVICCSQDVSNSTTVILQEI